MGPGKSGLAQGVRGSFAYLNAWTVLLMPVSWMAYSPATAVPSSILVAGLGILTFVRMGKGRWWRTPLGAAGKSLMLALAIQVAGFVGFMPVTLIGILGGLYGA